MRTRTTHKDSSIFYAESPVRETSRLSDSNSPSVSIFDPSPANSFINGFGGNELSRSQLRNESPVSAEYARRSNHTDFRQVHTSQKKDTSIFNIFSVNGVDSNESPRGIAQFAPKLNAQTLFAFGVSGLRHIWYTIRLVITASVSILNLRILILFFLDWHHLKCLCRQQQRLQRQWETPRRASCPGPMVCCYPRSSLTQDSTSGVLLKAEWKHWRATQFPSSRLKASILAKERRKK